MPQSEKSGLPQNWTLVLTQALPGYVISTLYNLLNLLLLTGKSQLSSCQPSWGCYRIQRVPISIPLKPVLVHSKYHNLLVKKSHKIKTEQILNFLLGSFVSRKSKLITEILKTVQKVFTAFQEYIFFEMNAN